MKKPRIILSATLAQMASLSLYGVDVRPNAHSWVNDASIQAALDEGRTCDTLKPHTQDEDRAVRIASYVRMIDAGTLPRKLYAEMYFRGTALRFKVIDGHHRWRAMQFRKDRTPAEIHVFEQFHALREFLPECIIGEIKAAA